VYTKLVETSGIVQMRDSCFVILTIAHWLLIINVPYQ
jgi:hypothetical protein